MYTFTASGKGRGVYTKLRLINEIKSYVTYLIANSTAEIYFFSNIEIGHKLSNPHLHTQIWSDDLNAVNEIYKRVIDKFSLSPERCKLSFPTGPVNLVQVLPVVQGTGLQSKVVRTGQFGAGPTGGPRDRSAKQSGPDRSIWCRSYRWSKGPVCKTILLDEPQRCLSFYDYVIKDYGKNLNDDEVWNLEQTKKRMRKTLGLKLRFYSRSKSKYTSKLYKMVYHAYGVLRAFADRFIEFMRDTFFVKKSLREEILKRKNILSISSFITITEQDLFAMCMFCTLVNSFLVSVHKSVFPIILFYSPARSPPFLRSIGSFVSGMYAYDDRFIALVHLLSDERVGLVLIWVIFKEFGRGSSRSLFFVLL